MNNNVRTLRGRLTDTNVRRIIVDDGRPNYGYKVLDFRVWPNGGGQDGVYAILSLDYDAHPLGRADDSRQIAWGSSTWSTGVQLGAGMWNVIDPDHIVIQDLYIRATDGGIGGGIEDTNYMIVVQPITLSDDEAILQLIKERSQDDQR